MLLERQKRMEEKIKKIFRLPARSPSEACDSIFRTAMHISIIRTRPTRTEFSLLRLLAENQKKIFSAKELYEAVWGSCAGTDTSTVRRHIFNLRGKIGAEDTDEYDIVSVYGKGYLFTCR